jgi:thiol-disulfide isomerase/thioredoxin
MRRLFALLVLSFPVPAAAARANVSERAALSGTYVNGPHFDIADDRGHVVIVNFWATWCTPCRAEMPMLDKYAADHRAEGVRLIAVSEDRPENLPAVRAALAGVHYRSAILSGLEDNSFGHPHILPETFVVGPDGRVRAILRSAERPLTESRLDAAVSPLLSAGR